MFIPPIGTSGLWSLKPPFAALQTPNVSYTLISIRKLTDILAAGGEPDIEYYIPNGLDIIAYLADLEINAAILSLDSGDNGIIYVPATYLNNYPDIGGIPYKVYAITGELGALPESVNLDHLITKIRDTIKELIGVTSNVSIVALSETSLINSGTSLSLESARQANISTLVTDYSLYLQAIKDRDTARTKAAALEGYIIRLRSLGII